MGSESLNNFGSLKAIDWFSTAFDKVHDQMSVQ